MQVVEVKRMLADLLEDTSSPSAHTPPWEYSSSPTWIPNTTHTPPWNQEQYKHCKPVVASWLDVGERPLFQNGALVIKTGGLGKLLVENKYEIWSCFLNDACALGGDYFFCYVVNQTTNTFEPWDQHSKLKLFQPQELKTELALSALESLARSSSAVPRSENCEGTPVQSFGQLQYKRCTLTWSWDDLYAGHANKTISFRMGTVGKWMQPGIFETYVCVEGHPCVVDLTDNLFCFVWSEVNEVFVPWGPNSVLKLLNVPLSQEEAIHLKGKITALESLVSGWAKGESTGGAPSESTTTPFP